MGSEEERVWEGAGKVVSPEAVNRKRGSGDLGCRQLCQEDWLLKE